MGEIIFKRTNGLTEKETHYCPGCTHGIAHRLVAEVLEEMNELDSSVCVSSVGCSVLSYEYFNIDAVEAAHGRAPAVATGIKRSISDKNTLVFTYQEVRGSDLYFTTGTKTASMWRQTVKNWQTRSGKMGWKTGIRR